MPFAVFRETYGNADGHGATYIKNKHTMFAFSKKMCKFAGK